MALFSGVQISSPVWNQSCDVLSHSHIPLPAQGDLGSDPCSGRGSWGLSLSLTSSFLPLKSCSLCPLHPASSARTRGQRQLEDKDRSLGRQVSLQSSLLGSCPGGPFPHCGLLCWGLHLWVLHRAPHLFAAQLWGAGCPPQAGFPWGRSSCLSQTPRPLGDARAFWLPLLPREGAARPPSLSPPSAGEAPPATCPALRFPRHKSGAGPSDPPPHTPGDPAKFSGHSPAAPYLV